MLCLLASLYVPLSLLLILWLITIIYSFTHILFCFSKEKLLTYECFFLPYIYRRYKYTSFCLSHSASEIIVTANYCDTDPKFYLSNQQQKINGLYIISFTSISCIMYVSNKIRFFFFGSLHKWIALFFVKQNLDNIEKAFWN